jgi:hypothetical protein
MGLIENTIHIEAAEVTVLCKFVVHVAKLKSDD